MCVSCGCNEPYNDHGDSRHITLNDLKQAAQAADISTSEAAENIKRTCEQTDSTRQARMP